MSHLNAIALRLAAVFLITAMSAVVHGVADHVPVGQIMFWRSAVAIFPICGFVLWRGNFPHGLSTKHPRLHLTRSVFGALVMVMSFVSLAYLPVASAQALTYLAPVLTLPLAAWMLRERLSTAVVVATALGFGGVMAIVWSALAGPETGTLIGVAAGLGYAGLTAFVRVHIKTMTKTETTGAIAFYFAVVGAAVGLISLPLGWAVLSFDLMLWLVLAGLLGGLAHIAAIEATARAPVSTLAPFEYTGMIWALGFDVLIFRATPTGLAISGMAAIILAALLVTAQPDRARR